MISAPRAPSDPVRQAERIRQRRLYAAGGAAIIAGGVTGGVVFSTRGPEISLAHYSAMVPQAKSAPSAGFTAPFVPAPIVIPAPALPPPLAAQNLQAQRGSIPPAAAAAQAASAPVAAAAVKAAPPAVVPPPPTAAPAPAFAAPPASPPPPTPPPPPPPKVKKAKPAPPPPAAVQGGNGQGDQGNHQAANPGHGGMPPGQARKLGAASSSRGGTTQGG